MAELDPQALERAIKAAKGELSHREPWATVDDAATACATGAVEAYRDATQEEQAPGSGVWRFLATVPNVAHYENVKAQIESEGGAVERAWRVSVDDSDVDLRERIAGVLYRWTNGHYDEAACLDGATSVMQAMSATQEEQARAALADFRADRRDSQKEWVRLVVTCVLDLFDQMDESWSENDSIPRGGRISQAVMYHRALLRTAVKNASGIDLTRDGAREEMTRYLTDAAHDREGAHGS